MRHTEGVFQNTNSSIFRQRFRPVLVGDFSYAILSDRTEASEQRLGQWPVVKGELPAGDTDELLGMFWRWVCDAALDAMVLHPARGVFRLRLYGTKGVETLDSMTLRAEPQPTDDDDVDPYDVPPAPEPTASAPATPLDRLDRAVETYERAAKLAIWTAEKTQEISERNAKALLNTLRVHGEISREQLDQAHARLRSQDQINADLTEAMLTERMTYAEEKVEAAEQAANSKGKKGNKEPNPLIGEALRELISGGKEWLLGGNVPDGLGDLLKNPRVKDLLTNPKVVARLKEHPELIDQVLDFINLSAPEPAAGGAPDADPYDIPE